MSPRFAHWSGTLDRTPPDNVPRGPGALNSSTYMFITHIFTTENKRTIYIEQLIIALPRVVKNSNQIYRASQTDAFKKRK